eukprot:9188829-Pyramimonas_sp.AAC.1
MSAKQFRDISDGAEDCEVLAVDLEARVDATSVFVGSTAEQVRTPAERRRSTDQRISATRRFEERRIRRMASAAPVQSLG